MIVHNMEQGTAEWFAVRLGKPTGSNASKLVSPTGKLSTSLKPYAEKLAADILADEDIDAWQGNQYTERGHEVEPLARDWHAYQSGVDVLEVGFCTDDGQRYGASPDGLIGETNKWHGGAEYKCLPKEHVPTLLHFNKHGRAPDKYIPQTQMELMVCELEWIDLVYFHPKLPSLIIRMVRDEEFIKKLESQLSICIEHRDETLEVLHKMREAA